MTIEKQDLVRCIWNIIKDQDNTTFNSVDNEGETNPLYECKYNCDGYKSSCKAYITHQQILDWERKVIIY